VESNEPEISEELKHYLDEQLAEYEKPYHHSIFVNFITQIRAQVICWDQTFKFKQPEASIEDEDLLVDLDTNQRYIRSQIIGFKRDLTLKDAEDARPH